MKKVCLLLVSLLLCCSALADWSHGAARFKGAPLPKCILVGSVTIWYSGTLTRVGTSGNTAIYRGTGDVCIAIPKNYTGEKFKFETPGTVQYQYI